MKHIKAVSKAQESPLQLIETIVAILTALLPILTLVKGGSV